MLRTVFDGTPDGEAELRRLDDRGEADMSRVESAVREILAAVKSGGDEAVQTFNARFGRRAPQLMMRQYPGAAALGRMATPARAALELSTARVRAFHEHQRDAGFLYEDDGVGLGVRVLPVGRAGVYAPGGKARYPSSVIMSAVPAHVAGVRRDHPGHASRR